MCDKTFAKRGPIEPRIRFHVSISSDLPGVRQGPVYVGQAYKNPHGIWADTDTGTMSTFSLREACELVIRNMDLHARGMIEKEQLG